MDRLILSRRSGKNVLGAGAAAILSPPLAFGRPQGPNAGPRLTQSSVCAQLSCFPRRCDFARTFPSDRRIFVREPRGFRLTARRNRRHGGEGVRSWGHSAPFAANNSQGVAALVADRSTTGGDSSASEGDARLSGRDMIICANSVPPRA
jgi:hypothetical protein